VATSIEKEVKPLKQNGETKMTHRQTTQKVHNLHSALRKLRGRYDEKAITWDTYNECVRAINVDLVELGEKEA